jgi:ribonuclease D
VRDILGSQLVEKGHVQEALGQFAHICKIEPTPMRFDESGFLALKGARQLNGRGLAVLRELYLAREVAAIKKNTPPFKVISEDLMLRMSVAPREGLHNLSIFKGVSGYVLANHGAWIREALQKGLKAPEYSVPRREVSREKRAYFESMKVRFKSLKLWRKETAARRNMLPEAIMSNDVLERLAMAQIRSLEDLQAIRGLGAEKASLYGSELLEFFHKHHPGK